MTVETFIRTNLPIYKESDFALPFEVEQKEFGKDYIITRYEQVENRILLLSEGIVQISTLKGDEEKILEFVFPGEFFCAYTSFLLQQPSDVQVITLADCRVSIIKREDMHRANQVSLVSSHLSLHIAQQLFLSRARREKDFLTLSAEDRYKRLLEKDPEVVQRIPGNKVAKYLGVQAESLSRIRKSIIT
ncbi:Crp/Fnr family transcriptional regulator [Ohtaekwangia koreensis]|uniref:cAMP-binding domain of CRP or a regulatory subunit of cAMP-dependent protein kinases n=1 Tax=Ohtaekwangia koreensis TaxID=688867 RepID=A0A1T5KF64_9BACT|nr:Crp/Fnr family transcriptional regulator [Ohtaekwangia koreensis]SKC62356.1 cAMP-binding domain of CRP or a regulatory subunit of cAMP-dependent protein kinases [Ohtaekwangia koreensis]